MNYNKIIYNEIFQYIFLEILLEGYSRRKSKYLKRIALFNIFHMMSMADPMAMGREPTRIESG